MSKDYIMIAPSYFPNVGGVEKHIFEVHRSLQKLGKKGGIVVFSEEPNENKADDDAIWINFNKGCKRLPALFKIVPLLKFLKILKNSPQACLHFHDYSTLYPFLPVLKSFGVLSRTFITFHGWGGKFPVTRKEMFRRQKCAESVQGNIAIGEFIPKWYGTKANVISYGGVESTRYSSIVSACYELPLRIAYIGRFEVDTGILEILSALNEYFQNFPEKCEVHLFGRGSLVEEILNFQNTALYPIRIYLSSIDTKDVLEQFPIIIASGYLTILEALCSKRIVIAYYNNPIRKDYLELHPAANSIFICGNVHDVVNAMTICYKNIHKACTISENGWKWAELQTWDNLAQCYIDLWKLRK